MRVFRSHRVWLNKEVLFKDSIDFIESFLTSNSMSYQNILFAFICYDDAKTIARFPFLEPFYFPEKSPLSTGHFSNAFVLWGVNGREVPQLESSEIKSLFAKVPRPFNPVDSDIILNGVNWFGREPGTPYIKPVWGDSAPHADSYLADCIHIKRFVMNKGYAINFRIELTDDNNPKGVADDTEIAGLIRERFGKILSSETGCVFNNSEQASINDAEEKVAGLIEKVRKHSELPRRQAGEFSEMLSDALSAAGTSFSVKRPLQAAFQPLGYLYKYFGPGMFQMYKITRHGFKLSVDIASKTGGAATNGCVEIKGFNFGYWLANNQILHSSQEAVDRFILDNKQLADYVEQTLEQELFEHFGATPAWLFQ